MRMAEWSTPVVPGIYRRLAGRLRRNFHPGRHRNDVYRRAAWPEIQRKVLWARQLLEIRLRVNLHPAATRTGPLLIEVAGASIDFDNVRAGWGADHCKKRPNKYPGGWLKAMIQHPDPPQATEN